MRVSGWKITERKCQGQGKILSNHVLAGFLLKTDQGDQIPRVRDKDFDQILA